MNKMFFCMILAYVFMINLSFAIGVKIENRSNDLVKGVELVFTGNKPGPVLLPVEYKSGIHHIRSLYVKYSDDKVYAYNFENYGLRGTGDMVIMVNGSLRSPGRAILIKGYKNMFNKRGSSFEIAINGGSIANWSGW